MKKVAIAASTPLVMCCKEKNAMQKNDTSKPITETADKGFNFNCCQTIIIDRKDTNPEWISANKKHFCYPDETGPEIRINFDTFIGDTDNSEKAAWLKENEKKINYEKSFEAIRSSHLYPAGNVANLGNAYVPSYTIDEIKKKLYKNPQDYDRKNYDYMRIALNPNGTIKISKGTFDPKGDSFSVPLLKSLEKEYDDAEAKLRFYPHNNHFLIRIKDDLYNFSHYPEKVDPANPF